MTTDVRALQHILGRDDVWHRSDETRWLISRVLGDGILTVEDGKHRQQVRLLKALEHLESDSIPFLRQRRILVSRSSRAAAIAPENKGDER